MTSTNKPSVTPLVSPGEGARIERYRDPAHPEGSEGLIATVIRGGYVRPGVEFHSESSDPIQVATICKTRGETTPAHRHLPIRRTIERTMEVLVFRSGRAFVTVYSSVGNEIASFRASGGDTVVFHSGGHSVRYDEDTIFVEVKQGPYYGRENDKENI